MAPHGTSRPKTLQEHFDIFVRSVYPDPPTPNHENKAIRDQYEQLRDAFYGGALVAHDGGSYIAELREYGVAIYKRARAVGAAAAGANS